MFSSGCSVWMRTEKRAIRTPRTAVAAHGAATQMRARAVTPQNLCVRSAARPAAEPDDRRLRCAVQSQVDVDAVLRERNGGGQRRAHEHAARASDLEVLVCDHTLGLRERDPQAVVATGGEDTDAAR